MKNTQKNSYSSISTWSICAVLVVVAISTMAITSVAHAQYYDYSYSTPSYDYSYSTPSYDYSYSTPSYDYSYSTPSYDYSYTTPSYDYSYSNSYVSPTYSYSSPSYYSTSGMVYTNGSVYYPTATAYTNGSTYYPQTYNYNNYNNRAISASCYSSGSPVVGTSVLWYTSISGGNNTYSVSWSGDEGLSGYGTTMSKVYNYAGTKNANITVTSGGQTTSVSCSPIVISGGLNYNYGYNYNNYYNQGYNYSPIYTSSNTPVAVSCSSNTNSVAAGNIATWNAYVSGGSGYYTYSWSGTDNLIGNNQSVSRVYSSTGVKTAAVTVSSNGSVATAYCSNSISVGVPGQLGYVVAPKIVSTNTGLDIGCYVDPASISVNQPVTWTAEVTGGVGPYTYSWTGSDSLSGSDKSVVKTYSTGGEKNAIVSVRSANGLTGTKSCTNTLAIRGSGASNVASNTGSNTSSGTRTTTTVTTVTTPGGNVATNATNGNGNQLAAASVFSFGSLPWGWIAILVILVLFGTVMYLLFNRQKI